ncbi:apolipoprotein N-acyltransferase [Roseateles toxinivorans]|uniref:Apolipoprotein N-acyltransferase n=1 Tax=Roseateles toxinivorans TaxID=270368 RepID=A0A4R6QRD6_9BURK|nr:apolipoprotein N-acyltransferase [Roseateles toxinivorans]TDP73317.1 apolipoprotein N-acyltransferase [Roseateles toxinivorans]
MKALASVRGWFASAPAMLVAGLGQTLSFAPFEAWWLQPLSLALLAFATVQAAPRRAAFLGWLFGVAWLVSGLWWLYISMHDFGGMPAWLAALAVVALAAALSLYYAAAMALFARLRGANPYLNALLWAACWLLAELARAVLWTGFPWIASGYAHSVGLLSAWAPWIGVYGLCALGAGLAFVLASLLGHGPSRSKLILAAGGLAVLVAGPLLPSVFTQDAGTLKVSLLQPNVAQNLKFDPNRLEVNLQLLLRQIASAKGDLVVTPESVVPLTRAELSPGFWADLQAPFAAQGRGLLIGIFTGSEAEGYVNSVLGLPGPGGADYVYGKRHLLPFGEFIPPGFRWFVALLQIPLGDQASGRSEAAYEVAGQRVRPLICYEDLFGEDVVASMVGPRPATLFVNVSNLAWFGESLVQDQHLQFSQMRALEFQRAVVRSTNTGATAVVDHLGRIGPRLPALTEGILEAEVQGRVGVTPYARWLSALGLWPLFGLAVGVLCWAWRRRGG